MEHALALAASALVFLICATAYPFLGFSTNGQLASMTLLDSAVSLINRDALVLGIIVFVLIFAAPLLLLILLTLLLTILLADIPFRHTALLARVVHALGAWNMVEVFLIGVLVSAAKISSMATLHLGVAFWAFIGFVLCTLASFATLDQVSMWSTIRTRIERP